MYLQTIQMYMWHYFQVWKSASRDKEIPWNIHNIHLSLWHNPDTVGIQIIFDHINVIKTAT